VRLLTNCSGIATISLRDFTTVEDNIFGAKAYFNFFYKFQQCESVVHFISAGENILGARVESELKRDVHLNNIIFKMPVPTSKKTHVSITKINCSMLFREITAVYS
jgi:hypothetical protein